MNLDRAYLLGADLSGADLEHAEFSNTDLAYSHLSKVDPRSTCFAKANLTSATIKDGTTDFWTVFRGATWIDGRICLDFPRGKCD